MNNKMTHSNAPVKSASSSDLLPIKETLAYVQQFGSRCRECADSAVNGVCPYSGLPCAERSKAIMHVIEAINYGAKHNFLIPNPVRGDAARAAVKRQNEWITERLSEATSADLVVKHHASTWTIPLHKADRDIIQAALSSPIAQNGEADVAVGDCIIAGIQSDDNSIEQMQAVLANLERAGYQITRHSPVESENMRSSGRAEQNTSSKTWTAGIDVLRSYPYQDTQWHLHAIEFHHKVREEAEELRDRALASWSLSPAVTSTERQDG